MKNSFKYCLCLIILIINIRYSYSQQRTYTIYYEECNNCNTNNQSYTGNQAAFDTEDIVSDFGRRRGTVSKWHKGIDYNLEGHDYVGDHLFSVFDGTIEKIIVTSGNQYKIVVVDGYRDLGYGHIFEYGVVPNEGMKYGDMVLKRMDDDNADYYAIIDLENDIAYGEIEGFVTYSDGTNTTEYEVLTSIDYDSPLAVIGRSGDNTEPYFDYHLHLYYFKDINIVNSKLGYQNKNNDKDPLEFINHPSTNYNVTIKGKELEISGQSFINNQNIVTFSGDRTISINVNYAMEGGVTGSRYNNVVMDVDDVELFIKDYFKESESYENWGSDNSSYKHIQGPFFDSKISHGGRLNSDRYFQEGTPNNNTYDIADDTRLGSTTTTGIYPSAYNSSSDGYPWDDYYFSDFKTRIHTNDEFGRNQCQYALCNEKTEARYPDGLYQLFAKVTTITDNIFISDATNPAEIIIDNFRPFIKKVEIRLADIPTSDPEYSRSWDWTGTQYLLEPFPCPGPGPYDYCNNIKTNTPIVISVYGSEAMSSVTLKINDVEKQTMQYSDDQIIWEFDIPASDLVSGMNYLEINGTDLAGNNILSSAQQIPIRQDNNVWSPDPANLTGPDLNHSFYVREANEIDFIAKQLGTFNNYINFTDISELPEITSYKWDFGDNYFTDWSEDDNVINHQYAFSGTYIVTHCVRDNENEHSMIKAVVVEDLDIPTSIFYYSIGVSSGKANTTTVSVDFTDMSDGIIASWEWYYTGEDGVPVLFSTDQNPTYELEMYTEYEIELKVGNGAGEDSYIVDFYYDPSLTPLVTIIPWQENSFCYDFEVDITNLQAEYNYTINYGDGTSETVTGEQLHWYTFTHQYFNWGTYNVFAEVTGFNAASNTNETYSSVIEITVSPEGLNVQLSYNAPSSPPYPGCQEVEISATVGGGSSEGYGSWYVYKIGDPSISYIETFSYTSGLGIFTYSFPEEGSYRIGIDVYSNSAHGHDDITIEVSNAPQFIQAGFYPLEPIQVGTGSTQLFESSCWPVGDPGVHESYWYPTNLRWTIFYNDIEQDSYSDNFDYNEYNFVHPYEYTFTNSGNYKLRLEVWNNNWYSESEVSPECVNSLPYYDYIEKEIIVGDDFPVLIVNIPDPLEIHFDNEVGLMGSGWSFNCIEITNPGSDPMSFIAEFETNNNTIFVDQIIPSTTLDLSDNETASFSLHVQDNLESEYTRYGIVKIHGYDTDGNEVQNSPKIIQVEQDGSLGPRGQYVYNNPETGNENFGTSVAIYKNHAVIGAVDGNNNGFAYIAEKNDYGYWNVVASLLPSDSYTDHFGRSVGVYEDYVIVGASNRVYFFTKPTSGWSGDVYSINSFQGTGDFGTKVEIWDDWAVVSSPDNDMVKIYYRNLGSTNSWDLYTTLTGTSGSKFGYNISLYNEYLAVGAPYIDKGEIHIFNRNKNSANDWLLEQVISAANSSPNNAFLGGKGFDLFDNKLFCSQRYYSDYFDIDQIYLRVFQRDNDGTWNWNSTTEAITPSTTAVAYPSLFKEYAGNNCVIFPGINNGTVNCTDGLYSKQYDVETGYGDILGGIVTCWPFISFLPEPIQYVTVPWNSGSQFGSSLDSDYRSVILGGPNKNGETINDCGAVYIVDYRYKSFCEANTSLIFENFEKPAGTYPDIEANTITLGGRGFDAIIHDAAEISYFANEIVLDDGFFADEGSEFLAEAIECEPVVSKSNSPENYEYLSENSFEDTDSRNMEQIDFADYKVVELTKLRKLLEHQVQGFPWFEINFFHDIDRMDIIDEDYKIIASIDDPNPIICLFRKDRLPDKYNILLQIGERKFIIRLFNPSDNQKEDEKTFN